MLLLETSIRTTVLLLLLHLVDRQWYVNFVNIFKSKRKKFIEADLTVEEMTFRLPLDLDELDLVDIIRVHLSSSPGKPAAQYYLLTTLFYKDEPNFCLYCICYKKKKVKII